MGKKAEGWAVSGGIEWNRKWFKFFIATPRNFK